MKKVGRHAWGSPKCGISLLKNTWADIKEPCQYRFLLARNPYDRLVSFYTEKIVDVNNRFCNFKGVDQHDWDSRNRLMWKPINRFSRPYLLDTIQPMDLSFKNYVMSLDRGWLQNADEHIALQVKDVPSWEFDDIIWLHDLPDCFAIPRDKLGIKMNINKDHLIRQGGTDRGDSHATPVREDLNNMAGAGERPAHHWWTEGAVPKDYSLFYDKETRDHVYYLFHEDFAYFRLPK